MNEKLKALYAYSGTDGSWAVTNVIAAPPVLPPVLPPVSLPVPEPEQYALLLLGLALVGAVARKTKKPTHRSA